MVPRSRRIRVLRDKNELYDEKFNTHLEGDVRTFLTMSLFSPRDFLFSTRAELEEQNPSGRLLYVRHSRPKEI
jgi:hypothetical protein